MILLTILFLTLMGSSQLFAQTGNAGQGTTLEHVAPWPPWVTIVILISAAVFTFGLYLRERMESRTWVKLGLATLRFSLICLVLWMMYGFTLRPFRTDLPDLLLLIDTSQSMATVDATDSEQQRLQFAEVMAKLELPNVSRLNQAKALLLRDDGKLPKFLHDNYQLKVVTLSTQGAQDQTPPVDLAHSIREWTPDAETSSLGTTLRHALQKQRGRPVAAVVYLTDGITTEGPPLSEVAQQAKQRKIPLHLIGLGSRQPPQDLRLGDLLVDEVVFVGDLITFDLTLTASGFEDELVTVTLKSTDGVGEPIVEEVLLSEARESQSVRLAWKAEAEGRFEFEIETPVREGEVSAENNRLRASVEVRDETTRVLLVQSYPSYEFHYLKTLLERDRRAEAEGGGSSVELSVLLQEADPGYAEVDRTALASFPTKEELFEYDVCIFGDVNPSFLGNQAMQDLAEFVRERGRGFVGIAGPRYFPSAYVDSPLADLIPFQIRDVLALPPDLPIEKGFRPRITSLGQRMPSMWLSLDPATNATLWAELPELYWLLEVDTLKPGVRVLADHPDRTTASGKPLPVATLSYVGSGKVLFHNTDDSWRWRIGRGDELFGRYWQQSLRYLSRFKLGEGRDVELTSDRETYKRGELVRLRARFFDERRAPQADDGVVVLLEQKARGQRRIKMRREAADRGVFTADVANLGTGEFHAWIAEPAYDGQAPSADFQIVAPDTERSRLEMDAADMRTAAEISGGGYYTYETADSLLERLPVGRQVKIESLPPEPVWNTWKSAVLFLVLIVAEWLLRRRVGMV